MAGVVTVALNTMTGNRKYSEDEHSEDIASLILQILEITSFTSTTELG